MAIETVNWLEDFNTAYPQSGDEKREGDDHIRNIKTALKATFPGMTGRIWRNQNKATNYTVVAGDNMSVITATAELTLALTTVATLGNGFLLLVNAVAQVTIDPAGGEQINGANTLVFPAGTFGIVVSNGTSFLGAAWHDPAKYLPKTGGTLSGALVVPNQAYDASGWDGNNEVPTKNAVRDIIQSVIDSIPVVPPAYVPEDPLTVVALRNNLTADSTYACYAVQMSNNTIMSWGRAGGNALGQGPIGDYYVQASTADFVPKIPSDVEIVDFAWGDYGGLVVLSNGWVYSTGQQSSYGWLGQGDANTYTVFTRIPYFFTNGISVARVFLQNSRPTGDASSSYFLTTAGTLYVCGFNGYGQLGIGTTTNINTPQLISGSFTGITEVLTDSGSYINNAGLVADNTLYMTGSNNVGQLGVGDTTQRTAFSSTGKTNVSKVRKTNGFNTTTSPFTPAYGHTMLIDLDGKLWTTGYNAYGQLGVGDNVSKNSFTDTGQTGVTECGCAGGNYGYSWMVKSGKLYTTGRNASGQLGQGNTTNLNVFTEVTTYSEGGTPPWNSKIQQVIGGMDGFGVGTVSILDTDGVIYFAGARPGAITKDSTGAGNTTLFTPIRQPRLQRDDEKIVKIDYYGVDSDFGIMALSNYGTLYAIGSSSYYVPAGGLNMHGQNVFCLRKVPLVGGY